LSVSQQHIIERLTQHVKEAMPPDPTGHDWPHVMRVLKNARAIHAIEGGNEFVLTLIALTHDLFDHKFFEGTQQEAEKKLAELLMGMGVEKSVSDTVVEQVFNLSFKGGRQQKPLNSEGKMVQDADRLEAIGAIGIARAFAYGGFKNRLMNSDDNSEPNTYDHFFEKLLKLYDLLNTPTAKKMAQGRFDFMREFVKRFEEEWSVANG
jgi:uncharacterized protein